MIAQVTWAVFTARREAARLKWEKERQGREWKLREAERFISIKQELYSRYISILYRPITDTMALTRSEYATQPDWPKLVPKYLWDRFKKKLTISAGISACLAHPLLLNELSSLMQPC